MKTLIPPISLFKRIFLTGIFLNASLLSPVCAHSAEEASEWQIFLDGRWQFSTNADAMKLPAVQWDTITVPGNWDTLPAYSTYIGKGWYQRTFTAPANWQGKHIRLHFGAVYDMTEVWLNGKLLGTHRGGYTPFEFNVTKELQSGENQIRVCADNTFGRGAWWHWGGISREVTLIANNDSRIIWQHIRTEPDSKAGTAQIFVEYKIANEGDSPQNVLLAATIDGTPEPGLAQQVTTTAHSETTVNASVTLPRERVRLWDFDHPDLYLLTTRLSVGGKLQHNQSDHFGIRKIEVTADSLLLNGERIRVCGFNRVSDSNTTGNTEPDWLVKKDVDLMKEAGADFSRLMHFPQAPNLLDYLDEKGMMIYEEIPVWGAGDPNIKPGNPLTEQWLRQTIERDYNHPCIIGWSVGNELLKHDAYVKSMIQYTRQLDPYRLAGYVSLSGTRKEYNATNDPISVCDILMHNSYSKDNFQRAALLHQKWPDKAIFFSEFGAHQIGASLAATIPDMAGRFDPLGRLPYVIGVSIWTFNDYRSAYKGTPASGNREWGVVTEDRQPKAAYWQIREYFSPVHSMTVSNRVATIQPRGTDEIPSYTLRGYRLNWKLLDAAGATLDSGEVTLPTLKPGSNVWTSQPLGNSSAAGATRLVVDLMSPTGYDMRTGVEQFSPLTNLKPKTLK
jgi:beta-galactosidase